MSFSIYKYNLTSKLINSFSAIMTIVAPIYLFILFGAICYYGILASNLIK